MASSVALRRLAGSILCPRGGITLSAATRSCFNTSSNVALHISRRHYSTAYPFTVVRGSREIVGRINGMNYTDRRFVVYEKPASREAITIGQITENEEALHVTADLPGLCKDDVIVYVHKDALHVIMPSEDLITKRLRETNKDKETKASKADEKFSTRCMGRLALTPKSYKANEVKAEMKNGQLHITVPRLKIEEREDLINIPVV